eukprot:m.242969 g.242969  ORF g.242969 m.242969 type:complete len:80 (+) comp17457_c1_seq3:2810-3049(+)
MAVPLIQAIRHQVGWLISDFNGSIIESSGQLLNQASIAAQALSLLQDTQQIIQQQPLRRLESKSPSCQHHDLHLSSNSL